MQTNDENAIFTLSGCPCAPTLFVLQCNAHAYFVPNIFIIYRTCGVFLASVTVILPNARGVNVLLVKPNGILMPMLSQCWWCSQWKIIVQVCGGMFAKVITKFSLRRWRFVVATTPSTAMRNNNFVCVCVCDCTASDGLGRQTRWT